MKGFLWKEVKFNEVVEEKGKESDWNEGIICKNV